MDILSLVLIIGAVIAYAPDTKKNNKIQNDISKMNTRIKKIEKDIESILAKMSKDGENDPNNSHCDLFDIPILSHSPRRFVLNKYVPKQDRDPNSV